MYKDSGMFVVILFIIAVYLSGRSGCPCPVKCMVYFSLRAIAVFVITDARRGLNRSLTEYSNGHLDGQIKR